MIKEIRYGGHTAQPSDYDCPDGSLSLSINILNEDGALRPLLPQLPVLKVSEGEEILLIHKVTEQENYILLNSSKLYWLKRVSDFSTSEDCQQIDSGGELQGFKNITAVGNTLCVSTANGVEYILWKDGSYKYLGTKPPFLSIRFGCYMSGRLESEGSVPGDVADGVKKFFEHYAPQGRGGVPYRWNDNDKAYWQGAENAIMGKFLSEIAENVSSQGKVFQPFYIRYAYRLYDGSYSWHSAPILMLPMTVRPFIYVRLGKDEDGDEAVLFKLNIPYFTISYRVCGDIDLLKEWSDIVTGLDVFFSQPIYTYQQEDFTYRPVSLGNFFINQGIIHRGGVSNTNKYLVGVYALTVNGSYEDQFISERDISAAPYYMFGFKANEQFEDRLQFENLFYKVVAFDLADINAMSEMENLPLDKVNLSNIATLETLPDDYSSHATILPRSLYTYNQRLMMTDVTIKPPVPFPIQGMSQALTASESPTPTDVVRSIKVYTRINGSKCVSTYLQDKFIEPFPIGKVKPRYLYHPDPSAFMMEIYTTGATYRYNLKQHPYLNGAYWFGGIMATPAAPIAESESTSTTQVSVSNKVYISQVNNPFVFPAESIVTIDCGSISSISTAAKALSQGQFGQFPLYAFTDNGVWALQVASTGVISAVQPITRDVCINADGITQLDQSVLFPTSRGLMLIEGSVTSCISGPIDTDYPFDARSLPGFDKLHSMIGHDLAGGGDSCLPTLPFRDFLLRCRMIYDYVHQRIIVYAPGLTYAYVYSLKSQLWGMMHSRIAYHLNSYPEALAVDEEGNVLNFCQDALEVDGSRAKPLKALWLTRPFKLDAPDVFKTVETVIQRGVFARGNVATVLYGSRNLSDWHLVSSSKDHFLRHLHGTPYKYFRLAGVGSFAHGESLAGATVGFTPRLTNRLR